MKASIIKPGLLVSLKTTLRGGVNYRRTEIETEHTTSSGALLAKWQTDREIPDPAEFEAATTARSRARALVAAVCCPSAFGLLCPTSEESKLQAAIEAARAIVAQFNAGAERSQIGVYVLLGRVAQDDAEAARAIASEVRELLEQMRAGIAAADPVVIREAANKARGLNGMLSADVAGQVSQAITEARKAAREITARVSKAGEAAALVVAELSVRAIDAARFSVLDLDAQAPAETIAPSAAGIDLPGENAAQTAARIMGEDWKGYGARDDEEDDRAPAVPAFELPAVGEPGAALAALEARPFALDWS